MFRDNRSRVSSIWRFAFAAAFILLVDIGLRTTQGQEFALSRPWSAHVLVPQTHRASASVHPSRVASSLEIKNIDVQVDILDQVATTGMMISIFNPQASQQVAEVLVPVPKGAYVRSFTFQGTGQEQSTELLESGVAKSTFDSIVSKLKDPALLEFAGLHFVRSSVFPVPAKGEQKIHLVFEQLLSKEGDRIDYVLPRSQSLSATTPWKIQARIRSSPKIATVYSPSHQIAIQTVSDQVSSLSIPEDQRSTPGSFRLSYLVAAGPLSASLITSPSVDGKGGHFLLLAGISRNQDKDVPVVRREVTLVLDRSGSMKGEKIEQAKQAAKQVVAALKDGEAFQIIAFNNLIEKFAQSPVLKSAESVRQAHEYIDSINANDGTNIHDALATSLSGDVTPQCLPIVLFLTDGLATVGNRSEVAIRALAETKNVHHRRIFTFGVGFDVNTPLLDKLATLTKGIATFVPPGENVEVSMTRVFKGLDGPMLTDIKMGLANQSPNQPSRIHDVLPGTLPDLYAGDQLVVLGRYRGTDPLKFRVDAVKNGKEVHFDFEFTLGQSGGMHFVPRLWASRKISELVDRVRDLGAQDEPVVQQLVSSKGISASPPAAINPQLKELTDSIIALSKEYGILTEYTSFLAEQGVDLSDAIKIQALVSNNLYERALQCRSGVGSWSQEVNQGRMRQSANLNLENRYVNSIGKSVSVATIQQCQSNALYNRNGQWTDKSLIDQATQPKPDRTLQFGSPEFLELLWKLVPQGRQDELALDGDILIKVGDEIVLIQGLPTASELQQATNPSQTK